jgi:MFS family permease
MFVPQVIAALFASLGGPGLAGKMGWKGVYLSGLTANLASMVLLIISRFVARDHAAAFTLLLAATAFLGLGFGLTVPAVNTFTAEFNPGAVDRSVLVLNALLGLGTALAPVFVAIFVGLGAWVGLPILAAGLLIALIAVSARLPLRAGTAGSASARRRSQIPATFWVFAAFAVLYGFCETMNGNWSQIDLTKLHVSVTMASLSSPCSGRWSRLEGSSSRPSSAGCRAGSPTTSCRSYWPDRSCSSLCCRPALQRWA